MAELVAVVLAAGKGTRMKSDLPKVLHCVAGKPMILHVLDAAQGAGCKKSIAVLGFGIEKVTPVIEDVAQIALQEEQLGTGHAVMQAKELLSDFNGTVMILCGDTPLLDARQLRQFYEHHVALENKATILTAIMDDVTGYGRIVRSENGQVLKIVEQKDADIKELDIKEINTGIYCIEKNALFEALDNIDCNNSQGEYYLTDVIDRLVKQNYKVGALVTADPDTVMGINSRVQLAQAEKWLRRKTNYNHMDAGVTIMDAETTYIDASVIIGQDTIIYPNTWLETDTIIGKNCIIGPNARLTNVSVGDDCNVHFTYAHDATIGKSANVGPFVHLRPGTRIADEVKVGNFVEVKNSWVGRASKLPHLSYIGDADIGEHVNIGCGTITVNYDGEKKHRTKIGDGVFVGCNSNLVAPVELHDNSYIAAGSTITKDVPEKSLAVARERQKNIENWNKK